MSFEKNPVTYVFLAVAIVWGLVSIAGESHLLTAPMETQMK